MKVKIPETKRLIWVCVLCAVFILGYIVRRYFRMVARRYFRTEGFESSSQSFIDQIDRFVYINLDNRQDRREHIVNEMKRMGIPDNKIQRVAGVYIPKNGHKGCVQSHILALRLAKMNNWKQVVIFEDDATIADNLSPEDFKARLEGAFTELPADWDVLMLGLCNRKDTDLSGKKYISKVKFGTCGYGYVVHSRYYDKLIRLFEYCNSMMTDKQWGKDNNHEPYALDQKWAELQDQDNWFCMKGDDIIKSANSRSTINAKGA